MKRIVRYLVLCIISALIVNSMWQIFKNPERFSEEALLGFYEEDAPIDILFLGASRVYMFWEPALAYKEYGIASYNLTISGQTVLGNRYLLEEALKTQSPSLVVVEMSSLISDINNARIHRVSDTMKLSQTKVEFINKACEYLGIIRSGKAEFYIPFIRFHSRWNELEEYDFMVDASEYKGSYWDNSRFLKEIAEFEYQAVSEDTKEEVDVTMQGYIHEFLDYIEEKDVNVLFIAAPTNSDDRKKVNWLKDILNEREFEYMDFNYCIEDIGLVMPEDYCDDAHTNVSGAIKFTSYLGSILKEEYNAIDRRNDAVYVSWGEAFQKYYKVIEPYLSDEEKEKILSY